MLRGAGLLAKRLDAAHDEIGFRQDAEVLGQHRLDLVDRRGGVLDVRLPSLVGVRVVVARVVLVVAQFREERRQVALEADFVLDRLHLAAQARDLGQADLVNLIGGQRRGGLIGKPFGVERGAIGQRVHAGGVLRRHGAVFSLPRDQRVVTGLERAGERRLHFGQHRLGARVGQRAFLLERGDLRLGIRPHRAVGAGLSKRRAGDDLRRFVDDEVVGKSRRPHARGRVLLRDLRSAGAAPGPTRECG